MACSKKSNKLGEKENIEDYNFTTDFPTEIIQEGEAKILVPKLRAFAKSPSDYAPSKAPVFYNPIMGLNRDIAVLAVQAYQKLLDRPISVCEPLTGCGVRGLRFALEVKGIRKVVINDISRMASQLASFNVQMNRLGERVVVRNEDANFLLASYGAPRRRFDIIDIDPFGSPVPYLDSAIRALRNGGLLALSATDMAPLCGVHQKACIRKYGGKPLRTGYCHELAVRLLAGCLATTAAKYDIGITIVFSHSTDHYIRIYAIIKQGARRADESIRNMGYILHCFKCLHRETIKGLYKSLDSRKCIECGFRMDVAGPLWLSKIADKKFCNLMKTEVEQRALRLKEKIEKMLASIKNEAEAPVAYYALDNLCSKLGLSTPSTKEVVNALNEDGFQAFLTHFDSRGIRSNASVTSMKRLLQRIVMKLQ